MMAGLWAAGRLWRLLTLRTTGSGRAGRSGREPGEPSGLAPTGDHLDVADERRAAIGGAWWVRGDER